VFGNKTYNNRVSARGQNQNDGLAMIESEERQNSEELEMMMDDLNSEMRISDLMGCAKMGSPRRIKTEQEEKQERKVQKRGKEPEGIFCLTAQEESSESMVKEFYFDLRQERIRGSSPRETENQEEFSQKKGIKELLYDFIDGLEVMEEGEIDERFYDSLKSCLGKVRKMESSKLRRGDGRAHEESDRKGMSNKNSNRAVMGERGNFPRAVASRTNKENRFPIRNMMEEAEKSSRV
jgi:hypothetical protein